MKKKNKLSHSANTLDITPVIPMDYSLLGKLFYLDYKLPFIPTEVILSSTTTQSTPLSLAIHEIRKEIRL